MREILDSVASDNVAAAKTAAILAAGNVANKQLVKLAVKQAPLMAKGYIDTPLGALLIANVAAQLIKYARPEDDKLQALTEGMVVSAYQHVISTIDIDGLVDEFLNQASIKKVLSTLEG